MNKHAILIEEPNIQDDPYEVKEQRKETDSPLNGSNFNKLNLIFRNQLSHDISLLIDKSEIITISNVIDLLLSKLNISKSENIIRLFFKGRPLKNEEMIKDLSK